MALVCRMVQTYNWCPFAYFRDGNLNMLVLLLDCDSFAWFGGPIRRPLTLLVNIFFVRHIFDLRS